MNDFRDRGRVDRGVIRPRSRSPTSRRRELKARDRSPPKSRPQRSERPRDRSHERRRRYSRSPIRDSREEVRERNRGRELLDTRGSEKPKRSNLHQSPSSGKRRKTRSPSPPRSHHEKPRREASRSPPRREASVSSTLRPEKKRRSLSPAPPRKRSPERRPIDSRIDGKYKNQRDSRITERRGRSPSPRHDRHYPSRQGSNRLQDDTARPSRSPIKDSKARERSTIERSRGRDNDQKRHKSPRSRQRSLEIDRYEPSNRSRQQSPVSARGAKGGRARSTSREREGRPQRDEYRPSKAIPKGGKPSYPTASGANSIEVKHSKPSGAASGANSIEVKSDKMNNRGYYGGSHGYNPNQQMQAAFPLKPQYNQGPQVDPRQYSQSPQHHMTPNSYHSSPHAQSPYSAGRGGWGGPQYSPQP